MLLITNIVSLEHTAWLTQYLTRGKQYFSLIWLKSSVSHKSCECKRFRGIGYSKEKKAQSIVVMKNLRREGKY